MTEINQLQQLQHHAAGIETGSMVDSPGLFLIRRFGWKVIDELIIISESNIMAFKSLHELAPKYMCNLFEKNIPANL